MKAKLHLLTTIATALATSLATAQNDRKPDLPPTFGRSNTPPKPDRPSPLLSPSAFLGIATSPLPPVLTAQLGLPEGFGLVVDEVLPDSPADLAGVKRFDVLRKFNDQNLVDPNQLAKLVRAQAKDTEVLLTLLRTGQEQKLTAKIVERPMPVGMKFPAPVAEIREQIERLKAGASDKERDLREQARDFEKRVLEYQERLKKWRANPETEEPKPPKLRPPADPAGILREVRPGGAAQVRVLEPGSSVTYNTANAKVLMKDDSGEIEVTSTDGRRHLIAKNATGETVFDGPIDTPEQLKALPEDLRKKVESVDVRTRVDAPARH